ncbi:hypothetical protein B0I35DRAFT_475308 [Stachybotrys elegans]|uniref:HTH La-type RNA-binding domain-containing protein n=1 Tax=Stachybotrys elegans TaxID=80388 RepID=A0A8K0WWN6_9HYPO|nr:hypothetical protein B0I35DRAFT_475308 [Stachybotrys elegans]
MAAPSTFSYAQAAKGQNVLPSNSQTDATSDGQSLPPPAADKASAAAENPAEPDAVRPVAPEKQEFESVPESDIDARSESVQERRSESKRDDDSERLNRPWRRNDKGTRSSSATTRSVDEQDSRKPRRGKKGKTSEKQTTEQTGDKDQETEPEPPKIELSEAPIPTVNIWHQRKEAQLAKAKPTPASQQDAPKASSEQAEDTKKSGRSAEDAAEDSPREASFTNGVKPVRKAGDAQRPDRNGSRGSRLPEKDGKDAKTEVPPPVEDATAWPTPEIATKEDKKKVVDKVDRVEGQNQDDAAQSKPSHKNKWITYDYVPSVSFETQVNRGSKPRGGARANNGPRHATAQQAGDKTSVAAPPSKSSETQKPPRESPAGVNGAAQPSQQGRRPAGDAAHGRESRKPAPHNGAEKGKDVAPAQATESNHAPRERPEGRNERGRGGFRGRGNHFGNSHSQSQSINSGGFTQGGGPASRAQGPYSPPARQNGQGQMYMPPTQRGGRGGRNAGSGNYHRMSLPNGSSRVPPVQTQFAGYEYPMAPMSAMPFQPPYWDHAMMPFIKSQIEYYFSIENLCKDMYLRKRMDSQGFVPLHFVAAFKRMRELSGDLGLIRAVCEESNEIDFVLGDDDCERLRRRSGWETFVLPMGERDELARNHGPNQFSFKSRSYHFGHPYNGMPPMPYGMASPPAYPIPGEVQYPPYTGELTNGHGVNGMMNGGAVNGHGGPSQLSADVPDFSPSQPLDKGVKSAGQTEGESNQPNGHAPEAHTNGLTNGVVANEASS